MKLKSKQKHRFPATVVLIFKNTKVALISARYLICGPPSYIPSAEGYRLRPIRRKF